MTSLLALTILATGQSETPGQLISKMIKTYNTAVTVSGTIAFQQSSDNISVGVLTELQYERPNKLFIRQTRRSSEPRTWLVTSDGKHLSYDNPRELDGKRLVERTETIQGRLMDISDMYAAASESLGDRSAALDIVISRLADLKFLRTQWATLGEITAPPGAPSGTRVIAGRWREYENATPSASYQIWISPKHELVRYRLIESLVPKTGQPARTITSEWVTNLVLDGKVDPSKFRVAK